MPVIVVASPKGGSGKSTVSVILGTTFAHQGIPVTMLDCDPNKSLTIWSQKSPVPANVRVLSGISEPEIIKSIKSNDADGSIVVVDLEGVASRLMSRAISQADLVIAPMRATSLDAEIGANALNLIAEEEEALGRDIPHAVVFTMTKALRSRQHSGIDESLREQGVDVIEPSLMERAAFSAIFAFGGDLYSMSPQGNMPAAIDNAEGFAEAVLARLSAE
jgi:chromosome partitioning protein|tara:strand:+ start:1987 stop:2643 length:657 start_codon:yes stop_codon:yes gene_type:complete